MFKLAFDWAEDREFGTMGWKLKGHPTFNAGEGLTIAHDTLEHFMDDDGSLKAELQAFGAMLYLRAEGGYFANRGGRYTTPAENMGADIGRFLVELQWGQHTLPMSPRTYALSYMEDGLDEILAEGARQYLGECDEDRMSQSEILGHIAAMRGWMRIGYRRARRRYHREPAWRLTELFTNLQSEIDAIKYPEEGDTLEIRVSPKKMTYEINVKSIYDDEDYRRNRHDYDR